MAGRRYRIDAGAVDWRLADDEVIAVDLVGSRYIAVNRTGSQLWPLLLEGATKDELTAALVARFEVGAETAAEDVEAFLRWLEEAKLLRTTAS